MLLNKTSRYCPTFDLLIAHQDEIENLLVRTFTARAQEIDGNEYLVIGTVDPADWKHIAQNQLPVQDTLEALHDFREVVTFKPAAAWGWSRYGIDLPKQQRGMFISDAATYDATELTIQTILQ